MELDWQGRRRIPDVRGYTSNAEQYRRDVPTLTRQMVPEFDTPKRARASEDSIYLNNFSTATTARQAGPSSPSRKGTNNAGSTPHVQRISPSRAHFGTNPKLFPTSSPRAYRYDPLPPLHPSTGAQPHAHAHTLTRYGADPDTSISSTRGIKEPPHEPYPYLTSTGKGAGHRRHHSHDARATGSGTGSRMGSTGDDDEDSGGDADRTLNGNDERGPRRPASIAASTIPLPPSPPHTAIMPSSFVLPAELRRAQSDATIGGSLRKGEHGEVLRMGSVKRERVPTPIPGDVGATSMRVSPVKGRSAGVADAAAAAGAVDEHGSKGVAGQAKTSTGPAQGQKEDVFSDFDRFFSDFPPPRRAGTALGMAEITITAPTEVSFNTSHSPSRVHPVQLQPTHPASSSSQLHRNPSYRPAEYPLSVALSRERSLPTPPLTIGGSNSSSGGSHTDSAYSATAATEHRVEHAIHSLQLVIQTLQATGADQATALLRQAELEMRLQSMDEELGQVREQNVRLEVQVRREREERRKVIKEAEAREGAWKEKLKVAEDATVSIEPFPEQYRGARFCAQVPSHMYGSTLTQTVHSPELATPPPSLPNSLFRPYHRARS